MSIKINSDALKLYGLIKDDEFVKCKIAAISKVRGTDEQLEYVYREARKYMREACRKASSTYHTLPAPDASRVNTLVMTMFMQDVIGGNIDNLMPTWAVNHLHETSVFPYETITTTEKETTMLQDPNKSKFNTNLPAFEMRPYVFGVPAEEVTDAQVFEVIGNLESEIASLNKLENKPKVLVATIDKLKEKINELIKFLDTRFASK